MIERFLDAIDAANEAGDLARAAQVVAALAGANLPPSGLPAAEGLPLVRYGFAAEVDEARAAVELFRRLWPKSHLVGELELEVALRARRDAIRATLAGIDDTAELGDRYKALRDDEQFVEAAETAARWFEVAPSRVSLAALAVSVRRAPHMSPDARRALLSTAADHDPDHVNDPVLATLANLCLDNGNVGLAQAACEVLFASKGGARLATSVIARIAVERKRSGDKGERDKEREQADLDYRRDQATVADFDRDAAVRRWLERFRPAT